METDRKAYSNAWHTTPTSRCSFDRSTRKLGLPFRNVVTDFDQRIIKQILIDGDEELERCEKELNRLNAAIIVVQNRRATIQREMESYRALLSPIQKIPPEILTEVFMFCAEDIDYPDTMEDMMTISMVCGRWRELALSVPALWSHIYLCLGVVPRDTGNYYPALRRYVETFLERSGNAPLTFTLSWDQAESGNLDMSVDEVSVTSIFDALRTNSSRVRALRLNVLTSIDDDRILKRLKASYPSLEYLDFSFLYRGASQQSTDIDFFGGVSALRSLSYRCYAGWRVRLHFPWQQLNRLAIEDARSQELLPILAMCDNLRQLEITDLNDDPEEGMQGGQQILPNLQLLAISTSDEDALSAVLRHLTVPRLESIKIRGLWSNFYSEQKVWTLASVRDLLTRSRCPVTSIELERVILLEYDTMSLLDLMPKLRSIKIVEVLAFDDRKGRPKLFEDRQNYIVTPSFLQLLSSGPPTRTSSSSFLPKLKDIALFIHRNGLDEASLVHAIASRCDGHGRTGHMSNTISGTDSCFELLESAEIRLLNFNEESGALDGISMLECFKDAGLRITLGNCSCYDLLTIRRPVGFR
ncbi:hypothetical protein AAF712_000294 [Marasmius tenuissimus]|uniref:F-box domain-containing protein n=1 Tax=Marasmius tenuissimus TaxID=585030 RepID=A0ABR3AF27_9AGAR|nr:hypothetical protein PM082_001081 [Marasmius tenuissimus]